MKKLRLAMATDDGDSFVSRHFGDANFYDVYDITPDGSEYILRVANDTEEEQKHADPNKAKGVAGLLKKQGVQVAMTRAFGPNIKRIKSKFVCILTGHDGIVAGLEQAQKEFMTLSAQWDKGEERDFLDLRDADHSK